MDGVGGQVNWHRCQVAASSTARRAARQAGVIDEGNQQATLS